MDQVSHRLPNLVIQSTCCSKTKRTWFPENRKRTSVRNTSLIEGTYCRPVPVEIGKHRVTTHIKISLSFEVTYQSILLICLTGYFDDNPFTGKSLRKVTNNPCLDEPLSSGMPVLFVISRAESDWIRSYLQANPGTELIIRRAGMVTHRAHIGIN